MAGTPPVEFAVANASKTFNQYRVNDKVTPNVTSLNFEKLKIGKFHIKKEDYDTFLAHVANYVYDERVPLGLVERPLTEANDGTRLSPLRVDLDFRFPVNDRFLVDGVPKRIIGNTIAEDFVSVLWNELCKIADYQDFEPDNVTIYVLQKPNPEHDSGKNIIKDGIHIFCKTIQMVPELHLFLRKRMLSRLGEVLPEECFEITNKQDIYDESVLYKGGWMIHGNRKTGKEPYSVLFRANYSTRDPTGKANITRAKVSRDMNKQLVKTFSIRHGIEGTYAIGIQEEAHAQFREFVSKNPKTRQSLQLNSIKNHRDPISLTQSRVIESQMQAYSLDSETVLDRTNDLKTASWLVDMLSETRSRSYDTWINVGICLRNMSRIEGLPDVRTGSIREKMADGTEIVTDNGMYNLWVDFSKKSNRYVEGVEEKEDWYNRFWLTFGSMSNLDAMIKRPTLRLWAKGDSPARYQKYLDTDIQTEISRVVRAGGTHVDVANLARIMYGDEYICANIKNSLWFRFRESAHRFVRLDSATTLRRMLSTTIRNSFETFAFERAKKVGERNARIRSGEISGTDGEVVSEVDIQKDELIKTAYMIARSLGQTKFLNDTITECKHRFYETYGEDFIRKLDTNKNLVCFNNGVYDLENDIFRDGRPEDMVSMTVGYDYVEYDEDDTKVLFVREIFDKIFTDKDVNSYMWKIMASVLSGENWRQEIYFMNGIGANGKSLLATWLMKAMGDYGIKPSVAIITDKRNNAQSASPETYSLKNKRLVYMEEPEEGDGVSINHTLLKDWSGGGTLRGRQLYGELESFGIMFKLFFSFNEFPNISTEEAMWRRIKVIHFKSKFLKPEATIYDPVTQFRKDERLLSDDFITEYIPQFMSILIEEYRHQWKDRKTPFREPDAVQKYSKEKRMESEIIYQAFDACFVAVNAGELATRYIGNPDLIRGELLTQTDIYNIVKSNEDVRAKRGKPTEVRKSIRTYLETLNVQELPVVHKGKTIIYYPFRSLTDS